MSTIVQPTRHQRIEYYFEALRKKGRKCTNPYEAHLHLESTLYEIELEHAESFNGIMSILPFANFMFFASCNVHFWESRAHVTVINCNGAYGIYGARIFSNDLESLRQNNFDPAFYKTVSPLVMFPSRSGKMLW